MARQLCRRTFLALAGIAGASLAGCTTPAPDTPPQPATSPTGGLPEEYTRPARSRGEVRQFSYRTTAGNQKPATIYLPAGYEQDTTTRYDLLYLMHGGGGNERTWLGNPNAPALLASLLDHLIEDELVTPLIVVAPTFDTSIESLQEHVTSFHDELLTDLIPAVESAFRSHALGTSPSQLIAARNHRAFGGFSMGSVTTWHVLQHGMDYFSRFLPLSGDSWVAGQFGGRDYPNQTAQALADAVTLSGRGATDFRLFAATGTEDIAYDNLKNQIESMHNHPTVFDFDPSAGNATFLVVPGNQHNYRAACEYVFAGLPQLLR